MGIETAKNVLKTEAEAILHLIERIGPEFEKAEQIILKAKGRVIVTGLGKSGIIGRKIASTLSSIGIPSFFLHPVEGAHGDIGMIMRGDVDIRGVVPPETAIDPVIFFEELKLRGINVKEELEWL